MDPERVELDWKCPHCGANILDDGVSGAVCVSGGFTVFDSTNDFGDEEVTFVARGSQHFEMNADLLCGRCGQPVKMPDGLSYQVDLIG